MEGFFSDLCHVDKWGMPPDAALLAAFIAVLEALRHPKSGTTRTAPVTIRGCNLGAVRRPRNTFRIAPPAALSSTFRGCSDRRCGAMSRLVDAVDLGRGGLDLHPEEFVAFGPAATDQDEVESFAVAVGFGYSEAERRGFVEKGKFR